MKIISGKITKTELMENYMQYFKTVTKAVADIEKGIIAIDGELHADLEALLLEHGSNQDNLWGINLYPFKKRNELIEYTALINIRPHQDNYSMEIQNAGIRNKIEKIVHTLIDYES